MPDNDTLIEDHENDSDLVKNLRAALKKANARTAELETEVGTFKSQTRDNSITAYLKTKNLPEKVAKLIPKDVEANDEALGSWLAEYGDVFGIKVESTGEGQDGAEHTTSTAADAGQVAALARAQQTSHEASADLPVGLQAKVQSINDIAKTAKTPSDVYAALGALSSSRN